MCNLKKILGAVMAASAIAMTASADAQEVKHYRFAYDQPKTTVTESSAISSATS